MHRNKPHCQCRPTIQRSHVVREQELILLLDEVHYTNEALSAEEKTEMPDVVEDEELRREDYVTLYYD